MYITRNNSPSSNYCYILSARPLLLWLFIASARKYSGIFGRSQLLSLSLSLFLFLWCHLCEETKWRRQRRHVVGKEYAKTKKTTTTTIRNEQGSDESKKGSQAPRHLHNTTLKINFKCVSSLHLSVCVIAAAWQSLSMDRGRLDFS